MKGEALWPGKSDVDQLYLIRSTIGDLLPRHMQFYKKNEFFKGIILPVPMQIIPLQAKLPMCSSTTIDFLEVTIILFNILKDYLWGFRNAWIRTRPAGGVAKS